jgi:DnaJ-class molecular chaperone
MGRPEATTIFTDCIGKRCYMLDDTQSCPGIFVRMLRVLDWALCLECNGYGLIERRICLRCNGNGSIKGNSSADFLANQGIPTFIDAQKAPCDSSQRYPLPFPQPQR